MRTCKTELNRYATCRRLRQLPATSIRVGSETITSSSSVRHFSVFIDADLSIRTHVHRKVASCFAVLHQICSIHRSLPLTALLTLVVSLVLSRLDYGLPALPARHSSTLPVRSSSPSGGRSDSPSPTVIFKRCALGPPDTACHRWPSGFSGRCCKTVERASRRHPPSA
jgi:hypothetical protein